jgi:putative redox protein
MSADADEPGRLLTGAIAPVTASKNRHVQFTAPTGHRLAGRLEMPADEPTAFALFAHCFTCTKDLKSANWISRVLAERNIATLRFDFTGIGASEGVFAETNFSTNLDDLVAAADWLREEYVAPQLLMGHSLGGAASIAAAGRVPEARAVATIAAPSDTAHLREVLLSKAPEIEDRGEAKVDVMGRIVTIKRQMLDDFRTHDLTDAIRGLGRPLLLFHAPEDDVVNFEHARRIFELAEQPKNFIALDGADHLLIKREADARYVAEVLAAWAGRYWE